MPNHQVEIDQKPFRSKADQEREAALQSHYQRLAIPAVVAAVQQAKAPAGRTAAEKEAA